jgi:hypothetical protein
MHKTYGRAGDTGSTTTTASTHVVELKAETSKNVKKMKNFEF